MAPPIPAHLPAHHGGKRKLLGQGFLLLFVLFLLVLVWSWLTSTGPVAMRGGGELEILKVTYGWQHHFVPGAPWEKWAAGILPASWLKRMGITVVKQSTPNSCLVVWTKITSHGQPPVGFIPTAIDTNGFEAYGQSLFYFANVTSNVTLQAFMFESFPRRDPQVRIRLRQIIHTNRVLVADLQVSNPANGPFADWSAEPLPQTRQTQGQSFSLLHLHTGLEGEGPAFSVGHWSELEIQVATNLFPGAQWQIMRLELADASGNTYAQDRPLGVFLIDESLREKWWPRPDQLRASFQTPLWPSEPAWKLKASFTRKTTAQNVSPTTTVPTQTVYQVEFLVRPEIVRTNIVKSY